MTEKEVKYKKIYIKVCPECRNTIFKKDYSRNEVYCSACGLVLIAPPVSGIITPGFKIITIKIPLFK